MVLIRVDHRVAVKLGHHVDHLKQIKDILHQRPVEDVEVGEVLEVLYHLEEFEDQAQEKRYDRTEANAR